jgi:xylose isomerase
MRDARYERWDGELGRQIATCGASLDDLFDRVLDGELDPRPASGQQELYENVVNGALWAPDRSAS